jgi:N6-L-threonylcarbamoyladenine synthase
MLVLGIETTCDETAASVVKNGKEILSNVIATQTDLHSIYGGVYPELACRRHFELIIPMVDKALKEANVTPNEIDLISVAYGPGLIGALLLGVNTAKSLSIAWNKPFIGVNHVEAHLYAAWMGCENPEFPALGVVISGGHTFLVKMESLGQYEMIGQTVDDAIGEAFDKVAVLLDLSYPGGPQIEQLARQGDPKKIPFKAGVVKGRPWDFSFSGLKTNVLYTVKGQNCDKKAPSQITEQDKPHIAAAFQEAALNDIANKALAAAEQFGCKMIFLGGGVTHNQRLRELFKASKVPVHWPLPGLSLDNAAMIAGLGYHLFIQRNRQGDSLDLEPKPRIPLRSLLSK